MLSDIPDTSDSPQPNMLIKVVKGDISSIKMDAISTVITPDLNIHGRLNCTIFDKAGAALDEYILDHVISPQPGMVFVTPAFDLPAQHIIFSVIPQWRSDLDVIDQHLLGAVQGIIKKARVMGLDEICIPMLGCGKKSYPKPRGVRLILQSVADNIGPPLKQICFICETDADVALYRERLGV